jgi:hypothetical protein
MSDHPFDSRSGKSAEFSTAGRALQPEDAFVVQLRSGPATGRDRLQGRVEHVVSGETLRFGSTAELVEFLIQRSRP